MPDTRPGITFKNGVCSACQAYDNRRNVDYHKRFDQLVLLCDQYRGKGDYDCIIAVSGGKDSHFQTFIMKQVMQMNPLLVTVEDNFKMTEAGKHNIRNISETFGCDIIAMKPNIQAQKKVMRYTFERYGMPTYFIDRYIYTYPVHMAKRFDIPLLVYGENVSYEYGGGVETYSAIDQLKNGVASGKGISGACVPESELIFFEPPDMEGLDPIYLSYFVEWNSYSNYLHAKKHGFHDLVGEWDRTHHVESFDQVDSRAYLVHPWLKYPKFGHASATDYCSRFIRYGMMTREDAVKIVRERDHDLDPACVRDFCEFLGYSECEFWKIVDGFYNRELFKKDNIGNWKLKKEL